jgi:hypothetical protein
MPPERAIVIDASVAIAPAGDVIALDLWTGEPGLTSLRALRVEQRRWWLIGAAAHLEALTARLGNTGALAAIGGGLMRASITGRDTRELLTVSGWFDAAKLGDSGVAATVIHHVPVWIAAIGPLDVEVYFAASYTSALRELWAHATGGNG